MGTRALPLARVEPHNLLFDFTAGGGLVAGLFGGVVAGVVAVLPIRLAVSLGFLQFRTPETMEAAVRGMLSAAVGDFAGRFALRWRPTGSWPALGTATVVCVAITAGVAAWAG